jgi:hypothetical protein
VSAGTQAARGKATRDACVAALRERAGKWTAPAEIAPDVGVTSDTVARSLSVYASMFPQRLEWRKGAHGRSEWRWTGEATL